MRNTCSIIFSFFLLVTFSCARVGIATVNSPDGKIKVEAGIEEGKIVLETLEEHYKNFEGKYCEVLIIRKFGVAVCMLLEVPNEIYLEAGAKLLQRVNVSQCVEELKVKLFN